MVKIKCPVCDGDGKVPSDFGGGCPGGAKKQCPACCGTGMQEVSDSCWKPCRKTYSYYPWNPCPQPYTPIWYTQPYMGTGSATTQTNLGINQYSSCASNTL